MPDLIDTVQLQEVDDALIELFDITLPDGTTKVYFCNGLSDGTDNIYFPSKDGSALNEYIALPIAIEGIETSSSGASNRPSLRVVNIPTLTRSYTDDSDGSDDESTLYDILQENGILSNEDLLNTKVQYRRTLFKHTYTVSDVSEWSTTDPIEFPSAVYIIDRVAAEEPIFVTFELASPLDIEGVTLPSRVVIGRYCPWKYQGYNLSPKDGGCNWPLDSNGRFFDVDDEIITKNISSISAFSSSSTYTYVDEDTPVRVKTTDNSHTQIWRLLRSAPAGKTPSTNPYYWYREDVCGKLITSCKLRFQGNNTDANLDTGKSLPFGGFPGSKTFK